MDLSKELETVKCAIRAVLMTNKSGISVRSLISDYRELNGTIIPYRNFNYRTLEEFLRSLTDTVRVQTIGGETTLTYVGTAETEHISQLVRGQRGTRKKPSRVTRPKPINFRRDNQLYTRPAGPVRRQTTAPRLMTAVNSFPQTYRQTSQNVRTNMGPLFSSNYNQQNEPWPDTPSLSRPAAANNQFEPWPNTPPPASRPQNQNFEQWPNTPPPASRPQNQNFEPWPGTAASLKSPHHDDFVPWPITPAVSSSSYCPPITSQSRAEASQGLRSQVQTTQQRPVHQQPQTRPPQLPQTRPVQQPQTPPVQQPQTRPVQQPQTRPVQQPQTRLVQQQQTPPVQQPQTLLAQPPQTRSAQQPQTRSAQQPQAPPVEARPYVSPPKTYSNHDNSAQRTNATTQIRNNLTREISASRLPQITRTVNDVGGLSASQNSVGMARTVVFENQGDIGRSTSHTTTITTTRPNIRVTRNAQGSSSTVTVEPMTSREEETFKSLLESLAIESNGEVPKYRAYLWEDKKTGKVSYLAKVIVFGQETLSFPATSQTPDAAEEEAARKAYEIYRKRRPSRSSTSSTPPLEEKDRIVENILQMFREDPASPAFFHHHIQSVYNEKFGEELPSNWVDIISNDDRIEVEKKPLYKKQSITIAPRSNCPRRTSGPCPEPSSASASALSSPFGSATSIPDNLQPPQECETQQIPDSLILPGNETWDVIVTKVVSASEVVMRLVDQADLYVDFVDKMNIFYTANPEPAKSLSVGKLYAARCDGATFRVHLLHIDADDSNYAICTYVDEGGKERLHKSVLCELQPQFLKLPFQAFLCQLADLKNYQDSIIGKNHLDSLIAEIEDNVAVAVPLSREHPITIKLYDTSNPEDRDLNEELLSVLKSRYYEDVFKSGQTATVIVSFVSEDGDFFVQVKDKFYNILTEILEAVTEVCSHKVCKPPTAEEAEELIGKDCYGFYEDSWYRARVMKVLKDKAILFYLDYGNTEECDFKNIRIVDDSVDPLHCVPYLANRCRLDNVPNREDLKWCSKTTDKWYQLVGEDIEKWLNMKVIHGAIGKFSPKVELFDTINEEPVVLNMKLASCLDVFEKQEVKRVNLEEKRVIAGNKPIVAPYANGIISGNGHDTEGTNSESEESRRHLANTAPQCNGNLNGSFNGLTSHIESLNLGEENIVGSSEKIPEPVLPPICKKPKSKDDFFDVFVTLAASPNNFTVQPYASVREGIGCLDQLMSEIHKFYECEENRMELHPDLIREGQFLCARWTDGSWYRVRVETIVTKDPEMSVMCFFVDYGDLHAVDLKTLQPLFSQFRKLPMQALKASLSNIVPVSSDWDVMASYEFANMVENKAFVGTVTDIKLVEGKPVLQLILCDTSGEDDVFIGDVLIQKSYARKYDNFS